MKKQEALPSSQIALYGKLFSLMEAVPSIEKTGRMEDGDSGYAYHERDEIVRRFRSELLRLRLLCIPKFISSDRFSNPTASGGTLNYSKQQVTYRFIDIDTGAFEDVMGVGHGCDPLDKDAPKAATQALKYFLVNAFFVEGLELDSESEQAEMLDVKHGAKWEGIVSKVEPEDTQIAVAGDLGYVFYCLIESKQERCFVNEQRKHILNKVAKKAGKMIRFRAMRHESGTLVVTKLSR